MMRNVNRRTDFIDRDKHEAETRFLRARFISLVSSTAAPVTTNFEAERLTSERMHAP